MSHVNYKFSNLLGAVYHKGNVLFTEDGHQLISPVGNKVSLFHLTEYTSYTSAAESNFNIVRIALDRSGKNLFAVNQHGFGVLIHLPSDQVICRHNFKRPVKDLKFCPSGRYLVACVESNVYLFSLYWHADAEPTPQLFSSPISLERTFKLTDEGVVSVDWSFDSKIFAVGCKDMTTRICGSERYFYDRPWSLTGHQRAVVAAFFVEDCYDLYAVDEIGTVIAWKALFTGSDLTPYTPDADQIVKPEDLEEKTDNKCAFRYERIEKHRLHEHVPNTSVTCAAYHRAQQLLVCGFANGSFALLEMPGFNLIHHLSMSDAPITTMSLNRTGDWIAVGCATLGQLLVWEWRSESYILKQQGHFEHMTALAYSHDGRRIATGCRDGKIKIWSTQSGFCVMTFSEHSNAVRGVAWLQADKAIVSASLDGTVRAFDMKRYRNFRTFTSHKTVQFDSVSIDSSGDLVCAGVLDEFDVYVWSFQTGLLLDVFSGHVAPVSGVCFAPNTTGVLATCSWDKTLRVVDVFENKLTIDPVTLSAEGLSIQFSPVGNTIGVCTQDCCITLFDWQSGEQTGQIEGRLDLDPGRGVADQPKHTTAGKAKAFTTFAFSPNGEFIVAGGQSRYICLYSTSACLILKKFKISCNHSIDGITDHLDRRQLSDYGNVQLMDVSDDDDEDAAQLKLPGLKSGEGKSMRSFKPEVRVSSIQFSPTARSWSACTTEGVLSYSLDRSHTFDPFQLATDVTPENTLNALNRGDWIKAVMMALKLNEKDLIQKGVDAVPSTSIPHIARDLPLTYVVRLLAFMSSYAATSQHLQRSLTWISSLFHAHALELKALPKSSISSVCTQLQQSLVTRRETLGTIVDHNHFTMAYLCAAPSKLDDDGMMDA